MTKHAYNAQSGPAGAPCPPGKVGSAATVPASSLPEHSGHRFHTEELTDTFRLNSWDKNQDPGL